jgi:DNA-directed RNA polymerase specialized sigma24 family protein
VTWELTPDALDRLLLLLDADPNRSADAYEQLRRRLARLLAWWGSATPDEHVDETMNRVARKVAEGERITASDPTAYFRGVARLVLQESRRAEQREDRVARAWHETRRSPDDTRERERVSACLDRCLGRLAPETRGLLLEYYGDDRIRGRHALAGRLGIAAGTLRVRVHRLREDLEKCLTRCRTGQMV